MTVYRMTTRRSESPISNVGAMIMLVLFFVAIYYIATGIFNILAFAAPFLLIATAIMDYRIITNYLKWVMNLFRTNIGFGIVMALVTFFGFPVVSGFLFAKALLNRKLNKVREQIDSQDPYHTSRAPSEDDYVEFEDVTDFDLNDTPLQLPPIEPEPPQESRNQYDDLFDNEK